MPPQTGVLCVGSAIMALTNPHDTFKNVTLESGLRRKSRYLAIILSRTNRPLYKPKRNRIKHFAELQV